MAFYLLVEVIIFPLPDSLKTRKQLPGKMHFNLLYSISAGEMLSVMSFSILYPSRRNSESMIIYILYSAIIV